MFVLDLCLVALNFCALAPGPHFSYTTVLSSPLLHQAQLATRQYTPGAKADKSASGAKRTNARIIAAPVKDMVDHEGILKLEAVRDS